MGNSPIMRRKDAESGQVKHMKNKGNVILAAIIMVPFILLISFLSVRGAQGNDGTMEFVMFGSASLKNIIELDASEVSELDLIYTSKNLHIYQAEGDQILVKEYLLSDQENRKAQVTKERKEDGSQKVTITGGKRNAFTFLLIGMGERIEIYLPKESLLQLALQTGSGNITKEGDFVLDTERLQVRAGSGNVKWQGAKADILEIKTGSGNITVNELAGSMELQAGSGNIKAEKISGKLVVNTGSGNITLEGFMGEGSAKAGSGNIKVEADQLTGDFDVKTSSGNIRLRLPKSLSFQAELQTGSGNIDTDFDSSLSYNKKGNEASGLVGDTPVCTIRAEAGSGNVRIVTE